MGSGSRWFRLTTGAVMLGWALGCHAPGTGKTVLRVAAWGGAGDDSEAARIEREVYEEFERRNPDVDIQLENTPGSQDYVRKMLLSFIAKAEPDVIRLDASSAAVFIDNGALKDLNPLAEGPDGIDLDEFYPNVVNVARRGQALYAIPVDFTPLVVYYNKRMFVEAGVSFPKPGWTIDDFLTTAKALTRDGRYGYTFTNWMPGWLPWLWNQEADVFGSDGKAAGAIDSPQAVRAVEWLRDLITVHRVAPSLSQMAAEGAAPFANATAAMETSGHWNLTTLASAPRIRLADIGISEIPVRRSGQKPVTVIYESGWAIGRNCRKPEIAWRFIRYFTSAEVQRKIQSTGIGICARKDISQERAVDDREREFLRIVPSGRQPWGATVEGYDFVEAEGQRSMDGILKSGRDVAESLRGLARAIDRQRGRR